MDSPAAIRRGSARSRNVISQFAGQHLQTQIELSPEDYRSEDLANYSKEFLIKIIHYLEQRQTVKQVVHEIKEIPLENSPSKAYYSPQLASDSPRQVTINECITILQEAKSLTFEDLIKQACNQNKQVAAYVGNQYLMKHNSKLRPIIQQLLEHSNIHRTGQKPIILNYI